MTYYIIVLTAIMLCTDFELPVPISDLKFRPLCESQWCAGQALVDCLTAVEVLPGEFWAFECMEVGK